MYCTLSNCKILGWVYNVTCTDLINENNQLCQGCRTSKMSTKI